MIVVKKCCPEQGKYRSFTEYRREIPVALKCFVLRASDRKFNFFLYTPFLLSQLKASKAPTALLASMGRDSHACFFP